MSSAARRVNVSSRIRSAATPRSINALTRAVNAREGERRGQAEDHDEPEQQPDARHLPDGPGDGHRHEEHRDQDDLEDDEVPVGQLEPDRGAGVDVAPRAREKQEQRSRAGERGCQEHAPQRPAVAPDRLIRDRQ